MIDTEWAREFAADWIDAWNSADLDRILAHYTDDFEMSSPLIVERMGIETGQLKGKDAIRPNWAAGLNAHPRLHFELIAVFTGANSVALHYRNTTRDRVVIEVIEFDHTLRGTRAQAMYALS